MSRKKAARTDESGPCVPGVLGEMEPQSEPVRSQRIPAPTPAKEHLFSDRDVTEDRKIRTLALGMLADLSKDLADIHLQQIIDGLAELGVNVSSDTLQPILDQVLDTHLWLGLEKWSHTTLRLVPGLRWFATSSMYKRLLETDSHKKVVEWFWKNYDALVNRRDVNANILVDAGSTMFRCFLHPRSTLEQNSKEITTNNVFVAQLLKKKVRLVGGVWDAATGAMVECAETEQKLVQHLTRFGRQPDVALLSWHWVTPDPKNRDNLLFWAESENEQHMKWATLRATRTVVFLVFSADKIVPEPPKAKDPVCYSLLDLVKTQEVAAKKIGRANPIDEKREVYILTDLSNPSELQSAFIKAFSQKTVTDSRIWLVCPASNTISDTAVIERMKRLK